MTPAIYRRYIRDVIEIDAPFPCPERALSDGVAELVGAGRFDLSAFREAVEWNLSHDFIRSADNDDTDAKEWRLTALGKAKQAE